MTERDQIVVNHLCKSLPNELACEIASISNLAERCEPLSRIMKDAQSSCRFAIDIFVLSLLNDLSYVLGRTFVLNIVAELRQKIESLIGSFLWKDRDTSCFQSKENMVGYIQSMEECQRKCRFFLQNECASFFSQLIDEMEDHILEVTASQTIDEELSKSMMSCFHSVYLRLVPCLYSVIIEDKCTIDPRPWYEMLKVYGIHDMHTIFYKQLSM